MIPIKYQTIYFNCILLCCTCHVLRRVPCSAVRHDARSNCRVLGPCSRSAAVNNCDGHGCTAERVLYVSCAFARMHMPVPHLARSTDS